MSNILRRPMFRGGRVSSYGNGIASGMGYATGGRVGLAQSYPGTVGQAQKQAKGLEALLAGINKPTTGADLLKLNPNLQLNPLSTYLPSSSESIGAGFGFMEPRSQFPNQYLEFMTPSKVEYETITTPEGDVVNKRDAEGNLIILPSNKSTDFRTFLEQSRTSKITEADKQGSEEQYGLTEQNKVKPVYNKKGEVTGYKGTETASVTENIPEAGRVSGIGSEKEEPVEYTVEDYIKMLGGDQARRRDLADMFGRISASALKRPARGEERNISDIFGDFIAAETAAGPGRREKIEQAAASLDIKDKIAAKRSKEQIELMKGKIDYELEARSDMANKAKDIAAMPTQDALTFIATEVYKGQQDRSSNKVLKTLLDVKLKTNSKIINANSLANLKAEDLPVGISIVNANEGRRVYKKDQNGNVELIDINTI